jgi:hypothetical protein
MPACCKRMSWRVLDLQSQLPAATLQVELLPQTCIIPTHRGPDSAKSSVCVRRIHLSWHAGGLGQVRNKCIKDKAKDWDGAQRRCRDKEACTSHLHSEEISQSWDCDWKELLCHGMA